MSGRSAIGRVATVALAAVLMAGCSNDAPDDASPGPSGSAAVTASFNDYAAAVTAKNGDLSADLMSAASRDYYNHLRQLALDADRATLAKQPVIDQITVLTLRDQMPALVLRKASAHDLVSRAVQLGLISQNSSASMSLEKITITGRTASAQLVQKGESTSPRVSYPVTFALEGDRWRFDITSLLGPAQTQMAEAAKQNQMTSSVLVEKVMEARTGDAATAAALWKPIGRS